MAGPAYPIPLPADYRLSVSGVDPPSSPAMHSAALFFELLTRAHVGSRAGHRSVTAGKVGIVMSSHGELEPLASYITGRAKWA